MSKEIHTDIDGKVYELTYDNDGYLVNVKNLY